MILLEHPQTLAYVASAIGVAMVVPQIQRIVRNPLMGGVSPLTWAITVVSCSVWIAYGIRTSSMPQVPGNILLVSGALAVVLLVPAAWSRRARAATLAGVVGALLVATTRLPAEAVGFLAFGIGLFGMWPQVIETVWLRRGMGPSAVSLSSTALRLVSQSLWFTFAAVTFDLPVLTAATMMLVTNTTVMIVEVSRRRSFVPPLDTAVQESPCLAAAEA